MYELKENGKVFTSKFVGTGTSSYEKRIYRAAVSQRLRNTGLIHVSVYKWSLPCDISDYSVSICIYFGVLTTTFSETEVESSLREQWLLFTGRATRFSSELCEGKGVPAHA